MFKKIKQWLKERKQKKKLAKKLKAIKETRPVHL